MPIAIGTHSMIPLGFGQAILGGVGVGVVYSKAIFHVTCTQLVWRLSTLAQELSVPRSHFVAIPIPDEISGCISESKFENCNIGEKSYVH